jgi:hypothetical protein
MSDKKSPPAETAEDIVRSALGNDAGDMFSYGMQDMLCYVRSLSLTELDASAETLMAKFHTIFEAILTEAVKEFLNETYGEKYKIYVDDSNVYDKDMSLIQPIMTIRKRKDDIEKDVMAMVALEFHKGRRLAWQVVARIRSKGQSLKERNYEVSPPTEAMEVELMRLERKFPVVTPQEWQRLLELYRLGVPSDNA